MSLIGRGITGGYRVVRGLSSRCPSVHFVLSGSRLARSFQRNLLASLEIGAGNEIRTRGLDLGKVD